MSDALCPPLLEQALRFAAAAHQGQVRKATDIPYFTHPVQVLVILLRAGFDDEELLAAALLHDVVEDCGVTLDKLRAEFTPRVAAIVAGLTERKCEPDGRKRPWADRKREHLEHLRQATDDVRAVALADKLHNLQTIAWDVQSGADVWQRFNATREQSLGYYDQVIQACVGSGDARLLRLAAAAGAVLQELSASPSAS